VDLFSNIDESDYGIDIYDESSSKWLVFGARGSLVMHHLNQLVRGKDDHHHPKLTCCMASAMP
jgi:hypothetical protein